MEALFQRQDKHCRIGIFGGNAEDGSNHAGQGWTLRGQPSMDRQDALPYSALKARSAVRMEDRLLAAEDRIRDFSLYDGRLDHVIARRRTGCSSAGLAFDGHLKLRCAHIDIVEHNDAR